MLAAVSGFVKGGVNVIDVAITACLATAFTVIVAKWGPAAVRRAAPIVHNRMQVGETQFTIAMIILLALAALAIYTGVAAIVERFWPASR